ncbi:MAG: FAD-dependent monooxygenase [Alphaproteobacteria bacterium]|nr:FAD-dependent monooxygenase [Alphaproteobacteria bacterium]
MDEIVVVGAGPAGLCAGLALAQRGVASSIVAAPHRPAGDRPDTRTAALFNPSIQLLRNLGVWDAVAPDCAPLKAIRLIDDTGGLFRAPEVMFEASEIGEPVFGFNVPQGPLMAALRQAADDEPLIRVLESEGVREFTFATDTVTLHLADQSSVEAKLVIAADGRNSLSRRSAGIAVEEKPCGQTALVCTFTHSRDHRSISSEFHRRAGPMTVVPMPGRQSSLVWVERPEVAERLGALSEGEFSQTLERNLLGLLGIVTRTGPRGMFPLSHMTTRTMARNRVALIGEAAHAMPPIGAQGLNLSFRDCAVMAELAAKARRTGDDPGSDAVLQAYDRARLADARERAFAVGSLNGALLSDLGPVQLARGASLHIINAFAPLRRALMHLGMAPAAPLPALMQPPAS